MEHTQITRYPAYKDSGVEWLGEIPTHWEINRLRTIANIVNGSTPSSNVESYWAGKTVWVTPAEINNVVYLNDSVRKISDLGYRSCGTTLVPKGSIVLTTRAPIGKVALAGKALCTNQGCKSLVLKKGQGEYLYFQLLVRGEELNSLGKGTTFMELGNAELKDFLVIFPPLPEQTRIAEFLDRKTALIDRAIAQKERLIALLRERRQILIHTAVTRGLNPDVNFKDSGIVSLGKIPIHWKMKRLKYLLCERNERSECGTEPLLMMSQVYGLVVRADYHDKAEVAQSSVGNKKVHEGDLVFNKLKAHLGIFFRSNIKDVGLVSPDYAVYYSTGEIGNLKILELLFRHPAYIEQFIHKATGIVEGLIRLYTHELFSLKVPVPPAGEQEAILTFIEKLSSKIEQIVDNQQAQIEKLQEYKATLINSAVTGKMRV